MRHSFVTIRFLLNNALLLQFGIFWTVGEICSATSRLLVEESCAERFFALLKKRTEGIKVGNPLDEETRLGPLVNESQYKKVLHFIQVDDANTSPSLLITAETCEACYL